MRALVTSLVVLSTGCFSPTYPEGLHCGEGGFCPGGQVCGADSICRLPGDGSSPDAASPQLDASPVFEPAQMLRYEEKREVDVLFVIDNSGSMAEEQVALVTAFEQFASVLQGMVGGLPNLHIGVVSSNVGTGGWALQGCEADGDGGRLQAAPRVTGCEPPVGEAYIVDQQVGDSRDTNYAGTLGETFACIATLGTSGCGFEQHLQSMRLALDPSSTPLPNVGFLRPDAYLAVIIVADEDDCSAADTGVFDTTQNDLAAPLGPLNSFRCTEFGVTCDGGAVARAAGNYASCEPNADTTYIQHPDHYASFLRSLKHDERDLIVAAIAGPPTPFEVSLATDNNPQLDASCSSPTMGDADPAVRLRHFAESFTLRGRFDQICGTDLMGPMIAAANLLTVAVVNRCLEGPVSLTDTDPVMPGLQLDCRVAIVENPGTTGAKWETLPPCAMAGDSTLAPTSPRPCWRVLQDSASCPTTSMIRLVIEDGPPAVPPGTELAIRCAGQ